MKTVLSIIIAIIFLTLPISSPAATVSFSEEVANKMVVELEQGRLIQEELDATRAMNVELQKQVALLKEVNKLQEEQIQTLQRAIEQYQKLLKEQGIAYEAALKNAKPNFWSTMMEYAVCVGIGVLCGLLI
jgi:uncharacterized protein YlxW (UPF0749 family)